MTEGLEEEVGCWVTVDVGWTRGVVDVVTWVGIVADVVSGDGGVVISVGMVGVGAVTSIVVVTSSVVTVSVTIITNDQFN